MPEEEKKPQTLWEKTPGWIIGVLAVVVLLGAMWACSGMFGSDTV